MKPILNFQLAAQLQHFRAGHGAGKEARLPVLLYLLLRCNKHLRCWPDVETIARETGIGKPRIVEALAWLVAHQAVMYVPVAKRTGHEQKLRKNRRIYQLTGVITLNEQPIEYLFLSAEERQQLLSELARLEATEILALWQSSLNAPVAEQMGSDSEEAIGSENVQNKAQNGSDSEDIELYPDQTPLQELNLSARDRAGTAPVSPTPIHSVQATMPPLPAHLETPPHSATPSPALFEVICQQGFKLDPRQLPVDPDTGKALDGGRIGKIRRAVLRLYPTITCSDGRYVRGLLPGLARGAVSEVRAANAGVSHRIHADRNDQTAISARAGQVQAGQP